MRRDARDPAYYDVLDIFSDQFHRFQIGAGHDHAVAEFLRTHMHICIIF